MRVRFAPSPTGYLHIGNARTAIINHLVARKTGATYVLRVEDTDMERSTAESERSILDDLRWLGISWHEGPDCGGNHGPYRQSERFDIYAEYTNRLLAEGKAYHCFCTSEELDAMREQAQQEGRPFAYPEKCRHLDEAAKQKLLAEGRKPTVRFHVPENEEIAFEDQIRGAISFNSSNIGGDFIIVRSDGVPVYNYIVVIDDHLMQVSHVIRGEDHLPNTPKQIAIARALGIESPLFAHLPLVLGDDRKKLSKRHGITSVELFRDQGYLPEALVNYIAMLGWATEDGSEIMSQDEIVERIDLSALGKSAAVFDFQKLRWMNSNYIRSRELEDIAALFIPYLEKAGYDVASFDRAWLLDVFALIRGNCELLSDITTAAAIFLDDMPEMEHEAKEMLQTEEGKRVAAAALEICAMNLSAEEFAASFVNLVKEKAAVKGKMLFMPCRALLTGNLHGPDLAEAMRLIGHDRCLRRVQTWAASVL